MSFFVPTVLKNVLNRDIKTEVCTEPSACLWVNKSFTKPNSVKITENVV